jgi:deoxyribonuclease V
LHSWDVAYADAVRIQESLREKLILKWTPGEITRVAGADVSYSRETGRLFAVVLVFSYPELDLLESRFTIGKTPFPYIPGLLTFREAPVLMRTFKKIETAPDLVVFDGQGIAHPRAMGLASHCGILLDVPTIGCAKNRLFGTYGTVGERRGSYTPLTAEGKVVGAVVRTREKVKPVFVSPGHKIDLEKSVQMVLSLCRGFRQPEPTRQAHKMVTEYKQKRC